MKLCITFLLLFSLFCSSCSSSSEKTGPPKFKVDESGMMRSLGGQLIAPDIVAHVNHWPTKEGQQVAFMGRDGELAYREIVKKEDFFHDFCLLHLSAPLDPANHFIAPVGKVKKGTKCVIYRHELRKPFSSKVYPQKDDKYHLRTAAGDKIQNGDSGKGWYQMIDGQVELVGVTSMDFEKMGVTSPYIYLLLETQPLNEK